MEFALKENRKAKRVRRRVPCEIRYEGRRLSGIVIDMSRTGLFVQSGTPLPLRTLIEVELILGPKGESVVLRAHVARRMVVPHQLAKGGIGLHIVEAPTAYYQAIDGDAGNAEVPPSRPRFRVRVKQANGPRSRVLQVDAATADEARSRALSSLEGDWEALAVEPL
jgi:hypothetical protein